MKRNFLIFLLISCGLGVYLWLTPKGPYPYPYIFLNEIQSMDLPFTLSLEHDSDLNKKSKNKDFPQVLLVGDRMAKRLGDYQEIFKKQVYEDLKIKDIHFENWGKNNEGLHRTLQKLRPLKSLPRILIYHGGSEEFHEKTFFLDEKNKILSNLEMYNDDNKKTLFFSFPWITKFFYRRVKLLPLDLNITEDQNTYTDIQRQEQFKIGLHLFEAHLEELIRLGQKHGSTLVLLTTPLNYFAMPKKVCGHTTTSDIVRLQNTLYEYQKSGDHKMAFKEVQTLTDLSPGNALSYYLLGHILLQNNADRGKVFEAFNKSTAFDCEPWRATAIHNEIIRKLAGRYDVMLFDFDGLINQFLGQNSLFLDDIFPQDLYYQEAMKDLARKMEKILEL